MGQIGSELLDQQLGRFAKVSLKRETEVSTPLDAKTTCGISGHQSPGHERVGTGIENEGNRATH